MPSPKRPHHKRVLKLLNALSADLFDATACYFGGGTRIVLELDEYRASLDVDFLCADQDGYRELRNQVTHNSLGDLFTHPPTLLREVRADMYGIRTFVEIDSQAVKFEIIREARIPLTGAKIPNLPIACLDHPTTLAEKFLANTDRGLDKSTRSRDLIDLAFMAGNWNNKQLMQGLALAEAAYGASVLRLLNSALNQFENADHRKQCLTELEVTEKKSLDRGLLKLAELANR